LKELCEREHLGFLAISAVASRGIDELIYTVGAKLDEMRETVKQGETEPSLA